MKIAVLGGGAWGTALADLLARRAGQGSGGGGGGGDAADADHVMVWARESEVVDGINRDHVNPLFLPDAPLARDLRAVGAIGEAVAGAELVVSAAPSFAVGAVMAEAAPALRENTLVVSVSKGLTDDLKTMSEVLGEVLGPSVPVSVLSGPSFAREVHQRQPTAVVAAAADEEVALRAQRAFSCAHFRVYSQTDVIGVELGGALKNVIALAAGILEGLGLGHNARAALITRGLAEITRLGVRLGADPMTFAGLAGLGDLVLTATGGLSRNRSLGLELGRGTPPAEALAGKKSVAEGVHTARAAVALGERVGVELPIAQQVADILFKGQSPRQAIANLMERDLKAESWR